MWISHIRNCRQCSVNDLNRWNEASNNYKNGSQNPSQFYCQWWIWFSIVHTHTRWHLPACILYLYFACVYSILWSTHLNITTLFESHRLEHYVCTLYMYKTLNVCSRFILISLSFRTNTPKHKYLKHGWPISVNIWTLQQKGK